jgi:hypothetical protein
MDHAVDGQGFPWTMPSIDGGFRGPCRRWTGVSVDHAVDGRGFPVAPVALVAPSSLLGDENFEFRLFSVFSRKARNPPAAMDAPASATTMLLLLSSLPQVGGRELFF